MTKRGGNKRRYVNMLPFFNFVIMALIITIWLKELPGEVFTYAEYIIKYMVGKHFSVLVSVILTTKLFILGREKIYSIFHHGPSRDESRRMTLM
jgi:hypothetical protein